MAAKDGSLRLSAAELLMLLEGIKDEQVVDAMARTSGTRGSPKSIRVNNDSEFISKALDRWAYKNGVTLDFSAPASRHCLH